MTPQAAAAKQIVECEAFWSSPLTRALQTGMVALEPLLQVMYRQCSADVALIQCECNANATRMQCECNANAMRMQCECNGMVALAPLLQAAPRSLRLQLLLRLRLRPCHCKLAVTLTVTLPLRLPQGRRLELRANVREKKNWGGLDSIGRATGVMCHQRALEELRELDPAEGGPDKAEIEKLAKLQVV